MPEQKTRRDEGGASVATQTAKPKLARPPMYRVVFHNDDYTTREFVVWVLQTVFNKSETDAVAIMLHVHNNGIGVAGVYTFEVAETKVKKTIALAKEQEFPLMVTMEPESSGEDRAS